MWFRGDRCRCSSRERERESNALSGSFSAEDSRGNFIPSTIDVLWTFSEDLGMRACTRVRIAMRACMYLLYSLDHERAETRAIGRDCILFEFHRASKNLYEFGSVRKREHLIFLHRKEERAPEFARDNSRYTANVYEVFPREFPEGQGLDNIYNMHI